MMLRNRPRCRSQRQPRHSLPVAGVARVTDPDNTATAADDAGWGDRGGSSDETVVAVEAEPLLKGDCGVLTRSNAEVDDDWHPGAEEYAERTAHGDCPTYAPAGPALFSLLRPRLTMERAHG